MPRSYGGTVADTLVDANGRIVANAAVHVFDAPVGGSDVTAQMTDPDGTPFVGTLGTSAGVLANFADPTDRDLWANTVDAAGNEVDRPRVKLIPSDLRSRQATLEASGGVGGGGGSTVTVDADGTLVVDGTTVELATDAQLTAEASSRSSGDQANADALTAHENDATAAHPASAVSLNPTGLGHVSGTDVQAAVAELDAAVTAGTAGVSSFNTRDGAVTLLKADVTGTGLAASDVGAETPTGAQAKADAAETAAKTYADGLTAADIGADPAGAAAAVTTSSIGAQPADADLTALAGLDSTTAGAIASDGAGWVSKTWAQVKTALGLTKADVGLGNVDNTADSAKPVSTAQQAALDAKVSTSAVGAASGVASLGADGKVPSGQLPSSATSVLYAGTSAAPVTDAATARPTTDGPVYWLCAAGVTPTNALDGDLIYNASA